MGRHQILQDEDIEVCQVGQGTMKRMRNEAPDVYDTTVTVCSTAHKTRQRSVLRLAYLMKMSKMTLCLGDIGEGGRKTVKMKRTAKGSNGTGMRKR